MNLCEFSDIIADETGLSQRCCSDIMKETIRAVITDFRQLGKDIPYDNRECYEFLKGKKLGIKLGPIKLGCELSQLVRKKRFIDDIRKINGYVGHKKYRVSEAEGESATDNNEQI